MSVVEITNVAQLQQILQKYEYVILQVYGDWCEPCKIIHPYFVQLASQLPSVFIQQNKTVLFARINIDKNILEGIQSIPYFPIYHKGQVIKQVYGANQPELTKAIQSLLEQPNQTNQPKSYTSGTRGYKTLGSLPQ